MSAAAGDPVRFPELGFDALAGAPESNRAIVDEVRAGEAMGLGTAFISERYNVKEAATLCGAAGAVSERIKVATASTNHNTRHMLITASFATTMHFLTDGRFTLGLGRGIKPLQQAYGLEPITTAQLEDVAGLLRRLFHGEMVFGHDGPAGTFPFLHLDASFDEDIPLGLTAFGPQSLALAGRAYDQVVLHTFFTDETVTRAVETVRTAADQAGRDPDAVEIWSCFATVGDHLPEDLRLKKTVGRLATYLQGYGDLMVDTNGWDPEVLVRFRADEVVAAVPGAIDQKASTEQLEHIATLIPEEWLAPSAQGSPEQCAAAIRHQLDLGCTNVILHGASPDELAPIVDAYGAGA
jgi:probable F420-dependent oxidoreductase